ncbi:MAG: DNA translocase FtsK [Micavibrio sp.]|nr:MAG: DNA translocase FtsK [Micavibrio sp.]
MPMSSSIRTYLVRGKKNAPSRETFLPEKIRIYLAARAVDALGWGLCLAALVFAVMLAGYYPGDPSLNSTGTSDGIRNPLGIVGAYTADLLLQSFGLAAAVFPLMLAVIGRQVLKRSLPENGWRRLTAFLAGLIFAVPALAALPPAPELLRGLYPGGSVGIVLLNALTQGLKILGMVAPFSLIAGTGLVVAFFCFVYAAGIGFGQGFVLLYRGGRTVCILAAKPVLLLRRRFTQGAEEDKTPSRRRAVRGADSVKDKAPPPVIPRKSASPAKTLRAEKEKQPALPLSETEGGIWQLPPLDILDEPPTDRNPAHNPEALQKNAALLEGVLNDFGVEGQIVAVNPGPIITLYELEPAPGTKSSRIINLADDIARSMSTTTVRVAVIPGKNAIGIELPNVKRETVFLKELLVSREYEKTSAKLPLVLGKNIGGDPVIADLAKMPHLLVAGTTGSGKSVAVNTMILSLLYQLSPEQCRLIMIDPKMLELSVYDDIPHLLTPVVTEPHKAVTALKWAVGEMEDRYRAMSKLGVRNIEGYNARIREAREKGEVLMHRIQTGYDHETGKPVFEEQPIPLSDLPYIVVVVDEFADLMLVAGKEVEACIQRLAQMARAAGIHLIMATQRPSVDVITGVIKANFPTRISFQVTSKIDSRTILGEGGAEQLLGRGDMLFMPSGGQIVRVHGPFVDDAEVEHVVNFLKEQGEPEYIDDVTIGSDEDMFKGIAAGGGSEYDELYDEAVALVIRERKASTSFVQRCLQIGYNRAARIIEQMEKDGVIGPANHVGKREILLEER